MPARIDTLCRRWAALPFWYFVVTVYGGSLLIKIVVMLLISESARAVGAPLPDVDVLAPVGLTAIFISSVLVAPVLETAVYQAIPLWLGRRLTAKPFWPIAICAGVFASLHYQQAASGMLHAFVVGLMFCAAYWYRAEQPDGQPYLAVVLVHMLHNLLAWGTEWAQRSGLVPT
ncbi:CPBP family intramembrane glutamic endopeptidase [Chitinimonas sp. BJYL2]|uniref:CPBP family intramembrane glutamic endopeptidase n=1 Tax=Chitinimonas sp. BJYL2 TaxID=2976696 RepID=UPI0022B4A46E|nr:CPBP family intramembrane glutamic endopeptidase [Chitinimonas sp. BJYL2]